MRTKKLVSLFLSLVLIPSLSAAVYAGESGITVTVYPDRAAEKILSRAGRKDIAAVKNAAILNLTGNELSHPSQYLAEGAQMLYAFVKEALH